MAGIEGVRLSKGADSAPRGEVASLPLPVQRRATPPNVAVLQVGSADDALEHAADRAADVALARIATGHQHGPGCAHASDPTPKIQRKATVGREGGATSEDFTGRVEGMRDAGRALDPDLRRSMEHGFGRSLTGVRVHTGAPAAEAAAEIGALAFTTGNDIFFGAGQYRPGTPDGDHMIGHEIAHTLQQGGATRRISRRWDFKSQAMLNLHSKAGAIEPLDESRLVLKVDGKDGTPMVVKSEDQPIGLGQLLGKMQKSMADAKTIKYRSFNDLDLAELIWVLKDDSRSGRDAKWASYYDSSGVKNHAPSKANDDKLSVADKSRLARQGTVSWLLSNQKSGHNVVGMSFADGKTMENQAASGAADAIIDAPGYIKKLGMVTVIDIIFRNRDRIGANSGNWMTGVDGKITLIDNVDSAGNSMRNAWRENKFVEGSDDIYKLAPSALADTADEFVDNLVFELQDKSDAKSGIGLAGGAKSFLRAKSPNDPRRDRKAVYNQEFEDGLREARNRLIKTFGATRLSLSKSGKKARADKKKIKSQSAGAFATDSGRAWEQKNAYNNETKQVEDRIDTMDVDYYQILKDRVKKLKSLK